MDSKIAAVIQRDRARLQAGRDQQVRDRLLEQAVYGELTGDQADAEAERLGLERLSYQPPHADFDPMNETYWSVSMAVAWIAFRTVDMVRQSWDKYRADYTYWRWEVWREGLDGPINEGWHLQSLRRETLSGLAIASFLERDTERDPQYSMTVSDAQDALWIALKTDCFRATGVDQQTGQRVEIPPMAWNDLVPYVEYDQDAVRPAASGPDRAGWYLDLLMSSGSITLLWPAPFKAEAPQLPPTVEPQGDGYMPLYLAAQWIATQGGKLDFEPTNLSFWRPAYGELTDAIASERVRVVGTKGGNRGPVEGFHFADCIVVYPFASASLDLMLSNETYLQSHPHIDADHWRGGFDDSLVNRRGTLWSRLMVAKGDVRSIWPFTAQRLPTTGAPGRPSSMNLVLEQLGRVAAEGALEPSIRSQARTLSRWLATAHPGHPPLTEKTIANKIGPTFRSLYNARK